MRGYFFMMLLAIQFGIQPIITREFSTKEVLNVSFVGICEIFKFTFGLLSLLVQGELKSSFKGWTFISSLRVAAFPSFIYAFQNILIQTAYRNLDALVFNLINQTKLLWSALFLYIILGRRQSTQQIFALSLLMLAAVLLSSNNNTQSQVQQNSFELGIVPVILASISSGIATALSQSALQNYNRNSNVYSMELAVYSFISLVFIVYFSGDSRVILEKGLFVGFTWHTFFPIICNALGGLIVGQVTKYAGAVLKGYALVAGVVLTSILNYLIYHIPMAFTTWVSLPIVVSAILIHTLYPEKKKAE